MTSKINSPRFAFYYLLALVALIFMAIATGQILFQIINQTLPDIFGQYGTDFSSDVLKFAISAILIASPIFYVVSNLIYKSLFKGEMDKDSSTRRWLTYFILLVSAVIIIVFLIVTINNFLNGDWTSKFLLKMLTIIGIAASVFSFYLYDIRRDEVLNKKSKVLQIYFFASLAVVVIVFISALFIVESPAEARNRRVDERIINNFYNIESSVNSYYNINNKLPASLDELKKGAISSDSLIDPSTQEMLVYQPDVNGAYQLCANFRTDTRNSKDAAYQYLDENKRHLQGYQCLDFKTFIDGLKESAPIEAVPVTK
ncbi:MAG: DUF5671 domain-containing protein [Candidatus Falkowbacteria bacterium]